MHYLITGGAGFIGSHPVEVVLGLIDPTFGAIFSCCLYTLLCLFCIYRFLPRTHARSRSDLDVAKLLERDVVPFEASEAHVVLKGQVVLVTGAAGSIGSELCHQLLNYEPARVIALDNNETGLFDLVESLRSHAHSASLCSYIGDIRDTSSMERLFVNEQPQIVFHAAAYKHVPLLERHPEQALCNNALATFHLCRLAQTYEVDRFVFVSTDKAADPTNILGATKRLGEIVVQSLAKSANCTTRFCAVRFGNVIGSRGSVVPVFARQIERGGPVTVTDPAAMRYFMTIPEACGLVILTAALADQGGLYVLDMGEPVRILDLAIKMIRLSGLREGRDVPIVYTGLRPGERLLETLVAAGEELVPTMNSKIFSVKHGYDVPMLPQVTQWMLSLDEDLQSENSERLRQRLLELAQAHVAKYTLPATSTSDRKETITT
jgi:FlaA1/EpsC-like NDP-sugar epimerase